MAYEHVLYEKQDRIATITLNRPERLNAFNPPLRRELHQIFEDVRDDPEVWVAIITGAGDRAFSAGNDLKYTAEHPESMTQRDPRTMGHIIRGGIDCWKPIIAAVNGYALGGGCELALACDLIVASETAVFGQPEVRVGLLAGGGGLFRLPRQIPEKIANDILFTARHMTAQEAHQWGLVNQVVPPDEVMPAARRLAEQILANSPIAVRKSKELIRRGLDTTVDYPPNAWSLMDEAMRSLAETEDFIEGPRAFSEKRPPQWKGR
ncbi:MAG TPA: enoyl-CoA hydratase-related protein [Dehalococcoidia bacterium]|nr:enoyl-CoA hydratase-related protein [Dehalococcoidia bacterium]